MYNNVGRKIKTCAKVFAIIFILITLILSVALLTSNSDEEMVFGVILFPIGCFISWISFISIYAFGQLVENSDKMVALQKENNKLLRMGLFETE